MQTHHDLENKVTGNCIPKIDFASYDLIGREGLSCGNSSINYKQSRDCANTLKL